MITPFVIILNILLCGSDTTRKQKIYEGGFPRDFVEKEGLRGISEKTRFVVICLS